MRLPPVARGSLCAALLLSAAVRADFREAFNAYNAGNYTAAREEFLALAALGDAPSQFNLGAMALRGQGVPRDDGAGVGWLTAAAQNGEQRLAPANLDAMRAKLTDSQRHAADEILNEFGREALLRTALPVPSGSQRCGDLNPPRVTAEAAAEFPLNDTLIPQHGIVIVQVTVGTDGVPRDPQIMMALPREYFSAAAVSVWMHSHFAPAQRGGKRVTSRLNVKVKFDLDSSETMWNERALKQVRTQALTGDPDSQYLAGLAATLDPSIGISSDQAYTMLVSAAQGGNSQALYWAANSFLIQGTSSCARKALPWLRAAARTGQSQAQLALARELLDGEPAGAQIAEARSLLLEAAKSDDFYINKHVAAAAATSPLAELHDPALAAAAEKKLLKSAIDSDPQLYEAIAAAEAANGKFDAAVAKQQIAVRKARDLHWNTQLMEERLAAYQSARPWRGDLFALPPNGGAPEAPVSSAPN